MSDNFSWKMTSHIRNSISHSTGWAWDFAPAFTQTSEPDYARYSNRSPHLDMRGELKRELASNISSLDLALQHLTQRKPMIFVESDHLHVYLLHPDAFNSDMPRVIGFHQSTYKYAKEEEERAILLSLSKSNSLTAEEIAAYRI
jgi:hypothetical protein